MTIEQMLLTLGINVASSFVYDVVRRYFQNEQNPTAEGLKAELARCLNIDGAVIKSDSIVNFLAQNGDISISGSRIYASKSITVASFHGTQFAFGNNSTSSTDKSSIEAGRGAQIIGRGGARIDQNENGDIIFFA